VGAPTEADVPSKVDVYDLVNLKKIDSFETGEGAFGYMVQKEIIRAAISPDGNQLATGSSGGTITLWSLKSRKVVAKLKLAAPRTVPPEYTAMLFSADGKQLFAGDSGGTIRRWELPTGQEIDPPSGYVGPLYAQLSPDGGSAVLFDHSGRMDVWDLKLRSIRTKIRPPGQQPVKELFVNVEPMFGFTGDGNRVFLSTFEGHVTLWDAATGKQTTAFDVTGYSEDAGWLRFCTSSPDGKQLVLNRGRQQVVAVDAVSGKELWTSPQLAKVCMCYQPMFMPDGKSMYVGISVFAGSRRSRSNGETICR
jgi:WD40 repeat protein